jgi:hypothetical protein
MTPLTVITMWHDEAPLAGLFMRHYLTQGATAIHVIVDRDTTDNGPDIAAAYGATLHEGPVTAGMDDLAKVAALNALAATITEGYILVADADEFAYSPNGDPIRWGITEHLEMFPAPWYRVRYWQAYRHASEGPLDLRPVLEQRRHGSPAPFGQGHWCKPAIVRAALRPEWEPGHHYLRSAAFFGGSGPDLAGAHWAMAEPDLAVSRRLSRKARMSQVNYHAGLTSHDWHVTEAEIREECRQHEQDARQVE